MIRILSGDRSADLGGQVRARNMVNLNGNNFKDISLSLSDSIKFRMV